LLSAAVFGYKGSKSQTSADSKGLFRKAAGFVLLSGVIGLFKMHNDFKMSNIIFGMIGKLDMKPDQRGKKHQNERRL
jgi:hypothetical protein